VLGEKHPDSLTSMGNLAVTYCSQGRLKEAVKVIGPGDQGQDGGCLARSSGHA